MADGGTWMHITVEDVFKIGYYKRHAITYAEHFFGFIIWYLKRLSDPPADINLSKVTDTCYLCLLFLLYSEASDEIAMVYNNHLFIYRKKMNLLIV